MKVVVFGSTGRTGRLLVKQALLSGHDVTAFARNPERLDVVNPLLRVVQGNVLDPASVDRAVGGHEAVLSALGSTSWRSQPVVSQGVRNILDAMVRHEVRRFVVLSAAGALRERAGSSLGDVGLASPAWFFRAYTRTMEGCWWNSVGGTWIGLPCAQSC